LGEEFLQSLSLFEISFGNINSFSNIFFEILKSSLVVGSVFSVSLSGSTQFVVHVVVFSGCVSQTWHAAGERNWGAHLSDGLGGSNEFSLE
jgi:hypothetical protein